MTTVANECSAGEGLLMEEASTVLDDSRELRDQIADRLRYLHNINEAVDKLASCGATEVATGAFAQHPAKPAEPSDLRQVKDSDRFHDAEEHDKKPLLAGSLVDRQIVVNMRHEQLAELCERNRRISRMRQGQTRMRRDLQASQWHIKRRQEENELMQQRVSALEDELHECKLALSKKDAQLKRVQARERLAKTSLDSQEKSFLSDVSAALQQIQEDQEGIQAKMVQALAVAQQKHLELEQRATHVESKLHTSYAGKMHRCRDIAASLIFRNHLRYLIRIAFLSFQLYPILQFQN
eukprot:gnl/MRDRNA2_/MRDRNA2_99058_c0_seq1.p1 gnl/MRDRNA2_/MRDRNA2_99058_c0~~gnl/MRDRNA2_/MRDRNA2_99058_c0_seq1.p1  ORF type:complete len:295 (+),score=70.20 gnl/MRDRNA2_/MRDRNA2_99058_c0_seq1:97-981(+)